MGKSGVPFFDIIGCMNRSFKFTSSVAAAASAICLSVCAESVSDAEARLLERIPAVFERAEAQAKMLDGVMSEKPRLYDWSHLPPAKGTQGFGEVKDKGDFVFPRSWTRGTYKVEPPIGWTTGFFPGELWMLYRYTGKPEWKAAAERWTEKLEPARHFIPSRRRLRAAPRTAARIRLFPPEGGLPALQQDDEGVLYQRRAPARM